MLTENLLGQQSQLKTQSQQFSKSRKIWRIMKTPAWRTESPKWLLTRWWLLLETVWVILQNPTVGRMGKMWMMKRQCRASWAKMTYPAGWCTQSSDSTEVKGEVSAKAHEAWRIVTTGMCGRSRPPPWKRLVVWHSWIDGFGSPQTGNGRWCSCTCNYSVWRTYGWSCHCPRNWLDATRNFSTRKLSY